MFDAEKVSELIAEARGAAAIGFPGTKLADTLNGLADAVEALSSLRDAEAEALAEIRAIHKSKKGSSPRYAADDFEHEGEPVDWEEYTICDYDKTPWPCRHAIILGLPVPEGNQ